LAKTIRLARAFLFAVLAYLFIEILNILFLTARIDLNLIITVTSRNYIITCEKRMN